MSNDSRPASISKLSPAPESTPTMKRPLLLLPASDDDGGRIAGLASRIGRTIFGLLFAAGPAFMIFLVARDVPDIRAASAWTETPCTVLE